MWNKSFTLIEVLIAIFLITVGMAGSFNLIQRTIAFSVISASRLEAAYLAQGGVEIVRNARDSNWLAANPWDQGIADQETNIGKFTRTITVTTPEPDKMVVSVAVSWSEQGGSHQITAQTELYNWR